MITQKDLKENLYYDKDSGFFFHLKRKKGVSHNYMLAGGKSSRRCSIDISVCGKKHKAHRLAFLYVNGAFPDKHIDHINHNPADNRWCNLRQVANSENHKNMPKYSHNTSGFNGVCWDKCRSKWIAQIVSDGKRVQLGRYKNKCDAIKARKVANIKYGFHANHGITNPADYGLECHDGRKNDIADMGM